MSSIPETTGTEDKEDEQKLSALRIWLLSAQASNEYSSSQPFPGSTACRLSRLPASAEGADLVLRDDPEHPLN